MNTTIFPRVKVETKPKRVIATAMGIRPSLWGAEMHFLMEDLRAGGPKQVGNGCFLDTEGTNREPSKL